jgi:hypothetical protein
MHQLLRVPWRYAGQRISVGREFGGEKMEEYISSGSPETSRPAMSVVGEGGVSRF